MKITVVSPHRDDAAFSMGLSIEQWLGAGHQVHVLNCFTRSDYAPYSDVEALHPNDRVSFVSALRKREDSAWNKLAGGKLQFTDLDLLDAPIRLVCGLDQVFREEIRPGDRAVSRVSGAIAKAALRTQSSEAAFVLPLAVGDHIDHRVTRQAGLEALAGSAVPIAFYEDLPYAAQPGMAEQIEGYAAACGLDLRPMFTVAGGADSGAAVRRKERIAECYDSQVDSEVASEIARFCLRYGGRERLWANEAYRESALATPAHVAP